jgi:hypothetical protein
MKRTIIVATIATLASIAGCNWFTNSKPSKHINLLGNWKIDTIVSLKKDSNIIANLLMAMHAKDVEYIQFVNDSILKLYGTKDTSNNVYALKKDSLLLIDGTNTEIFTIKHSTDSTTHLFNYTDSFFITLKKL